MHRFLFRLVGKEDLILPFRFILAVVVICLLFQQDRIASASGPSEVIYGRAKIEEVISPVEIRGKLQETNRTVHVRLQGLSSPSAKGKGSSVVAKSDRSQDFHAAGMNYLRSAVQGKVVELWTKKGGRRDDKNRLLACVLIRNFFGEVLDVNGELIRQGFCSVTRDYLHTTFANYKILEQEAKRNRKGIWSGPESDKISDATK